MTEYGKDDGKAARGPTTGRHGALIRGGSGRCGRGAGLGGLCPDGARRRCLVLSRLVAPSEPSLRKWEEAAYHKAVESPLKPACHVIN